MTTNLTTLALSDNLTVAGTLGVTGATTFTGAVTVPATQAVINVISQTVGFAAFTDGGSTAGTFALTTQIPAGATVLRAAVTAITGFAGDTSAVMIIGDGSDTDRYNTSTVNVFTTAANGADAGEPSGIKYHTGAKTVTLTVTSGADFTSVNAGSVTVKIYYLA